MLPEPLLAQQPDPVYLAFNLLCGSGKLDVFWRAQSLSK